MRGEHACMRSDGHMGELRMLCAGAWYLESSAQRESRVDLGEPSMVQVQVSQLGPESDWWMLRDGWRAWRGVVSTKKEKGERTHNEEI